jgi:N-acetylglutamate synthase/N-acetylornithine aminotransferase
MAKVIALKTTEDVAVPQKQVEIKNITTMKDASGNDVEVVSAVNVMPVDEAISQCESRKSELEAQLTELEAELAEYIAIRDAE